MERVSVVLPYYNRSDVLEEAITSVLHQTHHDLRLILVNDGSTDESREVARRLLDPRLVHIDASQNVGVSAARNLGLGVVETSLVAFMDSDDEWLPRKLEMQVAILRRRQSFGVNASVVGCGWYFKDRFSARKTFETGPFSRQDVLRGVAGLGTPMLLIDRENAASATFDTSLTSLEERDYVLSCLTNGSLVIVVPEVLAVVRRGRSDHVANPIKAARAWEGYIEKYVDELASDPKLRAWYNFRASREYLVAGDWRKASTFAREALRDRSMARAVHLSFGAIGRSKGLAVAQKLFPAANGSL